jgi:hypothetical protein
MMRLVWVLLFVSLFSLGAACSDDDYGKDLGGNHDQGVNTDGFDLAVNTTD